MTFTIKHRNGSNLYTSNTASTIKDAMQEAVKRGADLGGAHLRGADLGSAHLGSAHLGSADLRGADLRGADLRGADLRGADLGGAHLGGAHLGGAHLGGAHLGSADLRGADLRGAHLGGADLGGAHLGGAHLGGADLGGADLGGADLREQWIIQGATRADGHVFFLQKLTQDVEPMVKAGCRYLTLPVAWKHWSETRGGTPLGDETIAIIDCMVTLAKARGKM